MKINRLQRLKDHLLELEKQTGYPLRKEPRFGKTVCPIMNFVPDISLYGHPTGQPRGVYYFRMGHELFSYIIFDASDSDWFQELSQSRRRYYTNAIMKWLATRK